MSFLASLSYASLARLRRLVKQVHMEHYPESHATDREADRIIEALGPDLMQKEIEYAARARIDIR